MSSDSWFPKRYPPQHPDRIQLYSMATPNGQKVSIALEEMALPYEAHLVHIGRDEQFDEDYLRINPNGKIPSIIDPDGPKGRQHLMMESGAILQYLAQKTGRLLSDEPEQRSVETQWLFFQMGHVGPMFGQFGHFNNFATEKCDHPYPHQRYRNETRRLLGVLDRRLQETEFVGGEDYSIVDIAIWPWVDCLTRFYQAGEVLALAEFEAVNAWFDKVASRPAVERGRVVCKPD